MALSDQKKSQLRKDWYECYKGDNPPEIMEKCADYWLSLLDKEIDQELENYKKEYEHSQTQK